MKNNQTSRLLGVKTIPAVGLGCMGMSFAYGPADEEQSLQILQEAWKRGYRHFDTADAYGNGHNERLLGQFLKKFKKANPGSEQPFIATKFGIQVTNGYARNISGRPEYVKKACEDSLERLGVDQISLFYMHRRDSSVAIEETVGAMAELVEEGKVAEIGLSEVSAETLIKAHAVHPIAALQSEYSLFSRQFEQDLLPLTQKLGISFVAYSPLGRGILSRDFKRENLSSNDFRNHLPRFGADAIQHNLLIRDQLLKLADENAVPLSSLCLAWALHRFPHVHVIPGTRNPAYLKENWQALSLLNRSDLFERLTEFMASLEVKGERLAREFSVGIENYF